MDIDKYLEPEFDFSSLDPVEFEISPDVTLDELVHVVRNKTTEMGDDTGYPVEHDRRYCIGFSHRYRCFEIYLTSDANGRIVFLTFKLLNEYEIGLFWCKKS